MPNAADESMLFADALSTIGGQRFVPGSYRLQDTLVFTGDDVSRQQAINLNLRHAQLSLADDRSIHPGRSRAFEGVYQCHMQFDVCTQLACPTESDGIGP